MTKSTPDKSRILILAAGTGGHVYPALSIAEYLQSLGWGVDWLGTATGIEARLVPAAGYNFYILDIGGLRGKGIRTKLVTIWCLLKSIVKAWSIIGSVSPQVVLGMGGYVAGPGGIAAWLRRKPLLLHEQNAIPGLTNRLLKPFASRVMQAFNGSFEDTSVLTTGNPIRHQFVSGSQTVYVAEKSHVNLLVVGGSLGALTINMAMPESLTMVQHSGTKPIKVWHQCGPAHVELTQKVYLDKTQGSAIDVQIDAFIDDMPAAFAWADIVVCRAGALTISELAAAGKAAVLIPYPYAVDDHQTANARILETVGAGVVIAANEFSVTKLAEVLQPLLQNENLRKTMSKLALTVAQPNATELVANQCLEAANG